MHRSALLSSVLLPAVLLATGCTARVPHAGGPAGPVTASPSASSATSTSPTPATSPTIAPTQPSHSATPTRPGTPTVLGPFGFGPLRLGMTDSQATATGLIAKWNTADRCHYSRLKAAHNNNEGSIDSSKETGINSIGWVSGVHTPEGVHVGSTRADVVRAYSDWPSDDPKDQDSKGNGVGWAVVPGNHQAYYQIVIRQGKVTEIDLELKSENCFG